MSEEQKGAEQVAAATELCGKPCGTGKNKSPCDYSAGHRGGHTNPLLRAYRTEIKQRQRRVAREKTDGDPIKQKEAFEILQERGVKNDHIKSVVYKMLLIQAANHGITPNRFLFQNGIIQTLRSQDSEQPLVLENPGEYPSGELSTRAELYAVFDAFWREAPITFEQWLADRLRYKQSAFELSQLLGKSDFGDKHKEWTSFLPRWNPIGLRPGYTQQEGLAWLGAQRSDTEGDKKKYLLVCSRNSFKSTFVRIHALCLTLCYPDARILIISETNKLSKKGMKEFRGYLELAPNNPTLFQQYFGEFCVFADGEGSSAVYDNPIAHLGLPQNSVESSSMESANTGSRFDYGLFDDPISRDNGTGSDENRAAALSKYGSIMRLREPSGFAVNVQTPWECDDLGDTMIKQNEADPEHPLAVKIDPIMEIKVEAQYKRLLDLTPDDVILNFLPKLTWRFVRDELRSPEGLNFFKSQYLCLWINEGDDLKVQFDHDDLRARTRLPSFFPPHIAAQTVMSLDRAFSTSRYADFSCIAVGRIQPVENKTAMIITDVRMERWKESELVNNIVEMIQKHIPSIFVAEQDRGWEELAAKIRQQCLNLGIPVPWFRWRTIQPTEKLKAKRAKSLELPLADGRLWFTQASWTEQVLLQFEKFDGKTKSNSSRKDDAVDAISLLYKETGPKFPEEVPPQDAAQREQEEEEEAIRMRTRALHERMFSPYQLPPSSSVPTFSQARGWRNPAELKEEPEEPAKPRDPRLAVFGSRGPWRL